MIIAAAVTLLGNFHHQTSPVTWVKLQSEKKGVWSAKAMYPQLGSDTALNRTFNREVKFVCGSLYQEFVYSDGSGTKGAEFNLKGVLSVSNNTIACALIEVQRTGEPLELVPLTVWLNGQQPVKTVWGNLVIQGSSPDLFASTLLLPALNRLRVSSGLDPLAEFPPGLLDGFVVTKANVSWIVPPGVAGRDAAQVKVSHSEVKPWADKNGPLSYLWPTDAPSLPVNLVVKWSIREDVPQGGTLQVSLFRNRDDTVPIGVQSLPVKDPPMEAKLVFTGIVSEADERLFVDVRIMNNGQTYYRNREPLRMPALGWQTIREVRLDRER